MTRHLDGAIELLSLVVAVLALLVRVELELGQVLQPLIAAARRLRCLRRRR